MPDSNFFKEKRPVEYGEESFYHWDKYCVDYDGHWAGQDRQVWTYKTFFTNSLEEALKWWKKSPSPKKIRERMSEKFWCTINIDKLLIPQQHNYVQQQFMFTWD